MKELFFVFKVGYLLVESGVVDVSRTKEGVEKWVLKLIGMLLIKHTLGGEGAREPIKILLFFFIVSLFFHKNKKKKTFSSP